MWTGPAVRQQEHHPARALQACAVHERCMGGSWMKWYDRMFLAEGGPS